MSDIGNFVGRITGKVANGLNSDKKIKCLGKCKPKITEHAAISWSDIIEEDGDLAQEISKITLAVNDYNPMYSPLLVGNLYACTKCNKIRSEGGIFSHQINKSSLEGDYLS